MALNTGARFGNIVVESRIGAGAQSRVYRAWDVALKRRVALKVLREGRGEAWSPQILHEAQIIASLDHPHIVKVYGVDATGPVFYVVMEYIDGGSLHDRVSAKGPLSDAVIIAHGAAIADALAHAHDAGVIHRDVKPRNLLLASNGTIKLADFGLATAVSGGRGEAGRVGTPHYMAPELWMGGAASPRSDIYSLAASLVFLLTGKPPFDGVDTYEALRAAHLGKAIEVPDTNPPQLRALIVACLGKSPTERPTGARDVHRALIAMRGRRASDNTSATTQTPTRTPPRAGDESEVVVPDVRLDAIRNAALGAVMTLPRVDLFRAALVRELLEARPLICVVGAADSALSSVVAHTASVCGNQVSWRSVVIGEDRRSVLHQVAGCLGMTEPGTPDDLVDFAAAGAPRLVDAAGSEAVVAIYVQLRRRLAPGDVIDLQRMAGRAAQRRVVLLLESGVRAADADLVAIAEALPRDARLLRVIMRSNTERRAYVRTLVESVHQLGRWTEDAIMLAAFRRQHLGELELLVANAANIAMLTGPQLVTTWAVEAALRHARWVNGLDDLVPEWRSRPTTWPTHELHALIQTLRRETEGEDTDVDGIALR
jgi:tRNA A-37 threonylcarbamoyl transferase component Bud32